MLLVIMLCYASFIALCLAMPKHYRDFFKSNAAPHQLLRLFRVLGWSGLLAAFFAAIHSSGWQIGPVLWIASMSVSAVTWVFMLPFLRRHI
ncbi:MAG: conserved rane protein of unknown function [Verrucomicrobiaceae bacterium]|nr:conserved rane protein of unknown function [Verrucomicrobiaceae bacterium]